MYNNVPTEQQSDLSPDLVKALIATEDVRFTEHSGIDAQGLFRAVVKRGILMQKSGGGGSTHLYYSLRNRKDRKLIQ